MVDWHYAFILTFRIEKVESLLFDWLTRNQAPRSEKSDYLTFRIHACGLKI